MRVVSLGQSLPNSVVDNHSIANAPALFEYDACVLDPFVVSTQLETILAETGEFRTADDVPVQAGASGAFHYGLGELLQQRRLELQRLLERGGLVVVFGHPTAAHSAISTLPGADRYCYLPAAPGVIYRPPQLIAGFGRQIRTDNADHPFAGYLQDYAGRLAYHAHWQTKAIPDFDSIGRVFGSSPGDAAAAVEFRALGGRIVFIPPPHVAPRGKERLTYTASILECIQRAMETPEQTSAPTWVAGYDLPGVTNAATDLEAASAQSDAARGQETAAQAQLSESEKFRGLLWRGSHYAFEPLVRDAFRALGFRVSPDLSVPAELWVANEVVFLETDAADGTVKERAYMALQRRIEAAFLHGGVRRPGLIVVNGERLKAPPDRAQPYSEALKSACETFGYALIPAETLFELVRYALEGADAAALAEIRRTILETEGLIVVEEREDDAVAAGSPGDADATKAVDASTSEARAADGTATEQSTTEQPATDTPVERADSTSGATPTPLTPAATAAVTPATPATHDTEA